MGKSIYFLNVWRVFRKWFFESDARPLWRDIAGSADQFRR